MDTRNSLINFGIFVLLFAFTFVFCLHALSVPSTLYGVLAIIGFVVCISMSIFNGYTGGKNGEAIAPWFYTYTVIASIIFVWYLTRCGTSFGWW